MDAHTDTCAWAALPMLRTAVPRSCGIDPVAFYLYNTCQYFSPSTRAPCFEPPFTAVANAVAPQATASMVWQAHDLTDPSFSHLAVKASLASSPGQSPPPPAHARRAGGTRSVDRHVGPCLLWSTAAHPHSSCSAIHCRLRSRTCTASQHWRRL